MLPKLNPINIYSALILCAVVILTLLAQGSQKFELPFMWRLWHSLSLAFFLWVTVDFLRMLRSASALNKTTTPAVAPLHSEVFRQPFYRSVMAVFFPLAGGLTGLTNLPTRPVGSVICGLLLFVVTFITVTYIVTSRVILSADGIECNYFGVKRRCPWSEVESWHRKAGILRFNFRNGGCFELSLTGWWMSDLLRLEKQLNGFAPVSATSLAGTV